MNPMKTFLMFAAHATAAVLSAATFQSVNFESSELDDLKDSSGADLTDSFLFQIGSFQTGFTPTADNTMDWEANWLVFDQAAFAPSPPLIGFSGSIATDGTTESTHVNADTSHNFFEQDAWLWVYNTTFPASDAEDCCPGTLPIDWALSDFSVETPVWGSRNGNKGAGTFTDPDSLSEYELQTYAIPEPGTLLFAGAALAAVLLVLGSFRKRSAP